MKKGLLGEKGKILGNCREMAFFWSVCGLAYFSLDSGCFCLTTVFICSVFHLSFFCFSSFFLLFFLIIYFSSVFLLSFLIQASSVLTLSVFFLARNRWAPLKQEKVATQKRHPKNGLGSAVPVSQPKNFEFSLPRRFCRTGGFGV